MVLFHILIQKIKELVFYNTIILFLFVLWVLKFVSCVIYSCWFDLSFSNLIEFCVFIGGLLI